MKETEETKFDGGGDEGGHNPETETPKQKCEREHANEVGVCSEDGTFIPGIG